MNAKNIFRSLNLLGVTAALAVTAVFFNGVPARADTIPVVAQAAPAWKLKDLNGRSVSFDQFKGKVVVVDFWATWCGPCIGEIPGYIELQKKYGAEGLVIVGISVDQKGAGPVKKFATAKEINYTIVMADDRVMDAFGGIESIPTTFLINREGKIIHRKVGAMPHEEYEKLVAAALH